MEESEILLLKNTLTLTQLDILLNALAHPGITLIPDGFFSDPELFLFMDKALKETLRQASYLVEMGWLSMEENRMLTTPQGRKMLMELIPWRWANAVDQLHGKA